MLEPVLREIRNYYFAEKPVEALGVTEGVVLADTDVFEEGQYVYIYKHQTLTGVYKLASIDEAGLRIDDLPDTDKAFKVYPLAIPKDLLDLASKIEQFNKDNPNGVSSESLGDYSVSYSAKDGVASWQAAFNSQLASYRCVYLEMPR